MYARLVPEREYQCKLMRHRNPLFSAAFWEPAGEPLPCRIELNSTPSKIDALLYAMRQNRAGPESIELYRLQLFDGNGTVFHTIHATAKELQRHNDGYLTSASGYTESSADGSSLAGFSDEQLLAEIRRRLAGRPGGF